MKTTAKLSFMMFVEWFIWGAWFVPLWLWLSKSGFSAGEIGWSYACTAIAAILSPILVGSITDRFFSAQKVLAVLMFAGALLMYFAAQQTTFAGFFPLLLAYSLTYMPTIALTNSIAFANVPDVERDFPRIRRWALSAGLPPVWHVVSCRKYWGMPISHRLTSRC